MKYGIRLAILICLLVVGVRDVAAEVRLAGIFTDHMVLQREKSVVVWGWANKGTKVTVKFAGQVVDATASLEEAWSVTLKPLSASMEGRPLRAESGDQSIVINDVLVGEVWHASGQSNMAMTVAAMAKELESVQSDIATADLSGLRFCRINEAESQEPLRDLRRQATWTTCTPQTVSGFSGVAFYFARRLNRELGVTIGVIDS